VLAVLIKGGLEVNVTELLDHDVLSEDLGVGLGTAYAVSINLAVGVNVLQSRDVINLCQLLGLLVQRL